MRGSWIGLVAAVASCPVAAAVPMTRATSGHATVPVSIDGQGPYLFVIDSGAEASAVYARFAEEHHLAQTAGTDTLIGQSGSAEAPLLRLGHVELDGHRVNGITAVRLDNRQDGVALPGIIGLDVIGDTVARFDFRAMQLSLGGSIDEKRAVRAVAVTGGLLSVPVTVNGAVGTAVIDTGARETRVNGAFARAAGLVPDPDAKGTTIYGATNTAATLMPSHARRVAFAGVKLEDRPLKIADLAAFETMGLEDKPAMLLGLDYLKDRALVIDFPRKLVSVE